MTRYIDADALNDEMYHKSFEVDDGRNVWNSGLWIRYKIFEEAIRDAPTVDAIPVRHGHWTHDKFGFSYCSECGERHVYDFDYCPDCGARMDEE